jgi:hypothetical protein
LQQILSLYNAFLLHKSENSSFPSFPISDQLKIFVLLSPLRILVVFVGGPKIGGSPWTQESRTKAHKSRKTGRQGISESLYLPQKLWIPLHVSSRPPFIRRRRDFYILRIPSNLRNIPSVNTYKNVFYVPWFAGLISYIYKSATSSHFKLGLLKRRLWLGFFLTPEALIHENHHSMVPESRLHQIP